jgi:hypothetical protein
MNRQLNSFWLYEIENYFSISAGALAAAGWNTAT